MNALWPAASRSLLRIRVCPAWNSPSPSCMVRREGAISRSISTYKHYPRQVYPTTKQRTSTIIPALRTFASRARSLRIPGRPEPTSLKTLSSTQIATAYDDVPGDYKDEEGLPFRVNPLTAQEATSIFGRGTGADTANHIMEVLHGRRVAGTLEDPSLETIDPQSTAPALAWLRNTVPIDEEESAARRAEVELAAMEADQLANSQRLGFYKRSDTEEVPNNTNQPQSVYGRSGLDEVREVMQKQWEEAEALKATQEKTIVTKTGTLMTTNSRERAEVELRRPGENPRLKYYLERAAKVVPDVIPEMSLLRRIGPSALFTFFLIAACIVFATLYEPPRNRLWPDVPPAAATILGLVAANMAIFILWHFPPAFAMLNKYFLSVPGYPRAAAVLGNVFSHQTAFHLFLNMAVLWFVGTRLHDDIGRANFLALYLASGTLGSFISLSAFALRGNFVTSSLGASGAVSGVVACYLYLHVYEYFKLFELPPDPMKGVPGYGILGLLIASEVYSQWRSRGLAQRFDHMAHLGGYVAGIVGGEALARNIKRRRRTEIERRKNLSMVERIKEWKS